MSRKSYPNVNAANQYARDVVRGKIVACQFVIQACQRHLDDLMAEKSKSFRYRFDKDLAERAAKFIQLLPHTKGEWAFKRMPITLEPWQLFVICCAFGWVNKGSRLRRFREVYTEIPRKNGKSAISAGVALYCFACDNEFGAEVYSGATTEKQAWEVFRPARLMCKRTPMLTEAFGIEVNASNMNRPEDGARFEPLIGNPGDGSSPHCAVVDEYHEHATDALYTTMLTGMGARRQPLMWAITTAGYNIEGPCYDKRREVIEMLNGSVPNDELFGIIYTVDEGDDWTDPQVLEKANPNIGVSVYREFLLSQQQRAKNNARLANVFKTKHLNIWVSARSAYFNLVSWQSCEDKSLTLEQFEGQPCILAFDLARKLDMNSMARLYTREIDGKTHYYSVAPRFWVPYDTVYSVEKNEDRRTAERFQKWVEMGVLTVTDGAEVDYRYILEEAKAANKISPVSESPIDPFGATGLSHDLADEDLNPITIIQNYTNMSDPMKELEAAIESGRFHHDGNPIMTWCIGNVVGKTIPGTRAFASSGTYTPSPETKRIRVTITGGGGGGGGCKAISSNETFFGAGGGAGGTVITILTPTQNSYPVIIGAGGAGGVSATNGLKGGDSSFGSVIAPGGEGGGKSGVTNTNGGNGGVPNIGDIRITGGYGGDGQSGNIGVSGEGGASYWGGGGRAGAGGGVRGRAFGSGGGGAYDAGYSGTSMTGGKGADGVCIIEEFA
ncbi:terminase large subunit [Escherichia coli]